MNIRFSGFGGQGIILSGLIYGEAAVLDGKNAIQTQSYGSESRGGACKSDVVISDEEIYELESPQVDVLVAMSQQAFGKYIPNVTDGGVLIIDQDLVQITKRAEGRETKDDVKSRGDNVALRDTSRALYHPVQVRATDRPKTKAGVSVYAIPATDMAFKRFGRKIIANMVVLGYMTALLRIVSRESLEKAIRDNVPAGTGELNTSAFEEGYERGLRERGSQHGNQATDVT